ncbi:MAG: dTMP kinase [Candidatus Omnitrophica bacterium]|nr:dTMP kinase [Candidatus Omnitrophota bacterium]
MKGKFITFEGSEGSGKSTQSRLLYQYLKDKGYKVIYLREPGGTKISEKIRDILLDAKNTSMQPVCETLLYMAARSQLVDKVIRPALLGGKLVICDRFLDSTLAYQGYGLGIDIKTIKCIGDFATAGIKPDLTIFLDLPVRDGLKYRHGIKDRIEKRSLNYHTRVRNGYLELAARQPRRIKIVKIREDKRITQEDIRRITDNFLNRH